MCVYMYVCMYVCMYICMYVCMYICMYVCMYVYMYVCIYVCMYVLFAAGCVSTVQGECHDRVQPAAGSPAEDPARLRADHAARAGEIHCSSLFFTVLHRSSPFFTVLHCSSPFFTVLHRSSPFFTVVRLNSQPRGFHTNTVHVIGARFTAQLY